MPRVALCITDLDVGGAERMFVQLAIRLGARGFETAVYCLGPKPPDARQSMAPPLEERGIDIEFFDARGARDAFRITRALAKRWRVWKPDLVQTFLFHANIVGRVAAWRARVPHVVSGIRVAERRYPSRLRVDRWTEWMVARHVAVSQSVADFSIEQGALSRSKMVVIPNGIDVRAIDEAAAIDLSALGVPRERRAVTYVGRLDPQKGIAELVEHCNLLFAKLPQHDLLIVGDGPQRGEIEAAARRSPLGQRVHVVGWRADVPSILRASDLLVLPSRWEGMSNAVLEAMAARLPIVTTDVEGMRELLGDSADEQLVAPGAIEALCERVALFAGNPLKSKELGAFNRERVERLFSIDRMVDAYAELYHSLVSRAV